MTRLQPPTGDNILEWSQYLDGAIGTVDTATAYQRTDYNKALVKARINERIQRENHVPLRRNQILALADLLDEQRSHEVHKHTDNEHPEPFAVPYVTRPTEIAAIAHIVFEVINGNREVVIEAPFGTLYCGNCGDFHPYHKFYINPDKPRGYDDDCRDCINERYERLKVA